MFSERPSLNERHDSHSLQASRPLGFEAVDRLGEDAGAGGLAHAAGGRRIGRVPAARARWRFWSVEVICFCPTDRGAKVAGRYFRALTIKSLIVAQRFSVAYRCSNPRRGGGQTCGDRRDNSVRNGIDKMKNRNNKLTLLWFSITSYHQGAGGALSLALTVARGRDSCRTAPPAHGADPRGRVRVPAGTRGRRYAIRCATVSQAVASLPRVEGGGDQFFSQDSSKVIQRAVDLRNFRRQIRLGRAPAAGARHGLRRGRRHPPAPAAPPKELEAMPLPQKGLRSILRASSSSLRWASMPSTSTNRPVRASSDPVSAVTGDPPRVAGSSRCPKNNPILVGGWAWQDRHCRGYRHRIVDGDVPRI